MDNKLTDSIQAWLDTPAADRNVAAGAELLLKLNRNKFLYFNIIRRPQAYATKLEYELKKHLRIRQDGFTLNEVIRLERTLLPQVDEDLASQPEPEADGTADNDGSDETPETAESAVGSDEETGTVADTNSSEESETPTATTAEEGAPVISTEADQPAPQYLGKRADHDNLPEEVRQLWTRNGEVFFKLKEVRNTLMEMESSQPCDRYELLVVLQELDSEYRANLAAYDAYKEGDPLPSTTSAKTESDEELTDSSEMPTANQVSAARKYLSKWLARLKEGSVDEDKKEALLAELQSRISIVFKSGGGFDPKHQEELESFGLTFDV